jgi:hypothetical protein
VKGSSPAALVLDHDNNPIVAWDEREGDPVTTSSIRVARWTGSGWDTSYTKLDAVPGKTYTGSPAIAVDSKNHPIVAWTEAMGEDIGSPIGVYVARWVGAPSTWDGSYGLAGTGRNDTSIVIDSDDVPWVGFYTGAAQAYAFSVFGKHQTPPAFFPQTKYPPTNWPSRLTINNKSGFPAIAFSNQSKMIFVQEFTNVWKDIVSPFAFTEGSTFDRAELAYDLNGNPLLAWSASFGGGDQRISVFIVRWNGSAWVRGPMIDRTNGGSVESFVVDKFGRAIVAWTQGSPKPEKIVVQQTNR